MNSAINIEVSLFNPRSAYKLEELENKLCDFLKKITDFQTILTITPELHPELSENVQTITFDENVTKIPNDVDKFNFYFYHPHKRSFEEEVLDDNSDEENETCSSSHWILPNKEFEGLFESLIFDNNVKEQIMKFSESAIIFGNFKVDKNLISCNRIILLHGPPGTGKTSLCKAIAQKLSIRLNTIYKFTHFIEINSHSLFSKWFSESGKLVAKLFAQIREMILQPECLVVVLIDEVESIAYDRGNLSGEPKDALRVVNAVLTQLDQLKCFSNVMIFATSNLMNTIDVAFLDRVDLKKLIGYPSEKAISNIFLSAINNLIDVGLIFLQKNNFKTILDRSMHIKNKSLFNEIVSASLGLSGRTLRKIPFLAHAFAEYSPNRLNGMDLDCFLNCMLKAIIERNPKGIA